ncbi:methionine synthase [Thermotoga sp. Ku-13t]|uniref:methionine synthase n=1 Tax=Thermotoga sp. Ku-13t TaxID=1755813 RepID=UPI001F49322C|nr:methionine synthase [Thermotoga sp. Ku-13t]
MVELYVPKLEEYMPDKAVFLARLRTRYRNVVAETDMLVRFNELFLEGLKVSKPIVHHAVFPVEELPSSLVPRSFNGVKRVSLFLSTLGKEIDELVNSLLEENRTYDAAVIDAWASEALEALNDAFDRKLRERFGKGTMRFSPGYGDVDIRWNRYIVELLRVGNVEVLDSGVMVPRKTTTCMIGWYDEEE